MARLKQVVVDCEVPSALARFWAAVLDDFEVRAYDAAEIARLAERGLTVETDPVVIVDGPHLEICFQQVALERRNKRPLHLDVTSTNWRAELDRLVALGATVKQQFAAHAWMQDPEGNDFCLANAAG